MSHAATNELPHAVLEAVSVGKYSREWWADTADRVVSTTAQGALAYLGVGAVAPNILHVDLISLAAVSVTAGLLAFLKALAVTRR